VEAAERFADGLADRKGLLQAKSLAWQMLGDHQARFARIRAPAPADHPLRFFYAAALAADQVTERMVQAAAYAVMSSGDDGKARIVESAAQASLLRDIFGPLPFRPLPSLAAVLAWNSGTVVKLATALYEEKAFERMPILAETLEEAGCDNRDILRHCRRRGQVHVRGCFVLDLLLGRE
jgi:hypothetical protein